MGQYGVIYRYKDGSTSIQWFPHGTIRREVRIHIRENYLLNPFEHAQVIMSTGTAYEQDGTLVMEMLV